MARIALADAPHQWQSLWDEPEWKSLPDHWLADLLRHLPDGRDEPLPKVAPVRTVLIEVNRHVVSSV